MSVHVCTASDLHPYECGKDCIHCHAKRTSNHLPRRCWLCWDGDPDGFPGVACSVPVGQGKRAIAVARAVAKIRKAIAPLDRAGMYAALREVEAEPASELQATDRKGT